MRTGELITTKTILSILLFVFATNHAFCDGFTSGGGWTSFGDGANFAVIGGYLTGRGSIGGGVNEPGVIFALFVSADIDEDGDGMSDAFEITYGFDPYTFDSNLDADEDGNSNFKEFVSGTDPRNPASALRVMMVQGPTLKWPSVPGKVYKIETSPSLQTGSWSLIATISAAGTEVELPVASPQQSAFYRVTVIYR